MKVSLELVWIIPENDDPLENDDFLQNDDPLQNDDSLKNDLLQNLVAIMIFLCIVDPCYNNSFYAYLYPT